LASSLPETYIPPDLGPKGYIAFGREEEHIDAEGDSVTRFHLDLCDAINIMCDVQHVPGDDVYSIADQPFRCGNQAPTLPGYDGAGAVWHLFRREDQPAVRRFLRDAVSLDGIPDCPPFYYQGKRIVAADLVDEIHDQRFMLTGPHLKVLQERYGVHAWTFEQYEGEGVIIPSNCPHQVRNLRACVKIAMDFVSPESLSQCLELREQMRMLAQKERPAETLNDEADVSERHFHDKLQVGNMALFSLWKAAMVLEKDL